MCIKVQTENMWWNILIFSLRTIALPWGFPEVESPRFQDSRHMKVVRSSALRIGRLYLQQIFLILISVKRLRQPQGHSAAERIMSMQNSNDTIENRTRDLPACSAVPQPTAPRHSPFISGAHLVRWWVNPPGWLDTLPGNETRLVGSLEIRLNCFRVRL